MISQIICTDVETTGLDPKAAQCIEVACVVFDVEARCVTETFSSLIHATENAAEDINRIPVHALTVAPPASIVWARVRDLVKTAQTNGGAVYMAHRAEFDRSFYEPTVATQLPWACSKFDVEWPRSRSGASLVEAALAHGIPVHDNHRALTDALLLAKLLQRVQEMGHVLPTMIARAMAPRIVIEVAERGYDPARNAAAKREGFRYESEGKRWTKRVPKDEPGNYPFAVREVSP